jgi:hypothetical protein
MNRFFRKFVGLGLPYQGLADKWMCDDSLGSDLSTRPHDRHLPAILHDLCPPHLSSYL